MLYEWNVMLLLLGFLFVFFQKKDVALQNIVTQQVLSTAASRIIMVTAEQLDRRQHVITAAPRLHFLVDHQLCWIRAIKVECQGRWAHTTLCWDEHCLARRTLHQWDSIMMTHLYKPPISIYCAKRPFVLLSVSQPTLLLMSAGSHPFE